MYSRPIFTQNNPLEGHQVYYRLQLVNKNSGELLDVTSDIVDDLSIVEEKGLHPELTFTLKNGDKWLRKLPYMAPFEVVFEGGTLNPQIRVPIFRGSIFRSSGIFDDKGVIHCRVIAWGFGWNHSKDPRNLVYPSQNSPYAWAKSALSIETLVKKLILEVMNLEIGEVRIPTKYIKTQITSVSPLRQNNYTDWGFLRYIAEKLKCVVWDEGGKVYFMPFDALKKHSENTAGRVSFYYPYRDESGQIVQPPKGDKVILLNRGISIDEDQELQLTIARAKDPDKNGVIEYTDFKLDTAKIQKMMASEAGRKIIDDIFWRMTLPGQGVSDAEVKDYFIEYKVSNTSNDNPFIEGDTNPFLGRTASTTITGNVLVKAFEYYPIYGISRFSSSDAGNWWFLKRLEHAWSSDGFTSTLNFIQ
jgi:hypothetical protein